MQHLRPVVDSAEARQVDVTLDVGDDLPESTPDQIATLIAPLAAVLDATTDSARIVFAVTAAACRRSSRNLTAH